MSGHLHEQFDRHELPLPPDRSTGLVFAVVAIAVAYFWRSNPVVVTISAGLALALAVVSFTVPRILRPLNILWMRFALLLSKVTNPVVMFALFVIAIVPTGLIMQQLRDPLRSRQRDAPSHWLSVSSAHRATRSSMTNQF